MQDKSKKIIVTGGAGFIGSAVCRHLIEQTHHEVIILDALTYAGDKRTLETIKSSSRYHFEHENICDNEALNRVFETHQPDAIMHLAAESHVDRSIDSPSDFIETNILGTYNLLEATRRYLNATDSERAGDFRFLHVSTDEVYGSLGEEGLFTEETSYAPNSPYSASKASSDHLVRAWHHTFNIPVITSNCSNNYGPYQFPEKFIPVLILNALSGKALPIYGKGLQIRDWLHVEDHAKALCLVLEQGKIGEKYNIGGDNEMKNIEVAQLVTQILDKLKPNSDIGSYETLIKFVDDRPGHDQRYAIDFSKISAELGWKPQESFSSGLEKTIIWYLNNSKWWEAFGNSAYGKRIGLVA